MLRYVAGRLLLTIPILLGVSIIAFTLIRLVPGDPITAIIGPGTRFDEEQLANLRERYGLNDSVVVQYAKWVGLVLQGDLGTSLRSRQPLTDELAVRLPVTLELTLWAAIIGTIPAVILGTLAALRRNSWFDVTATITTLLGTSVPNFLLAVVFVLIFAVQLDWLPPLGYEPWSDDPVEHIRRMILPSLCLGLPVAATLMRFTRSSVLETISQDYVRTARAKGMSQTAVVMRHVLPNASIPIITVLGIQTAGLLGGTIIIEQIFGLPGVGRYIYEAIAGRDYPVVQSVTLVIAAIYVLVSVVVDVLYAVIDPRLRTTT
ncbi:MAG TPA: ABC transporter permease [Thermomicrobiales bacterium]|jgi:peptide/nickel transport system permease protein|nr:ABC transporter permease [Thermomicrobiales bacterium]